MAVSEKKKLSNRKWDSQNLVSIGCKLRRDQADKLKQLCVEYDTSLYEILRVALNEFHRELTGKDLLDASTDSIETLCAALEYEKARAEEEAEKPVPDWDDLLL